MGFLSGHKEIIAVRREVFLKEYALCRRALRDLAVSRQGMPGLNSQSQAAALELLARGVIINAGLELAAQLVIRAVNIVLARCNTPALKKKSEGVLDLDTRIIIIERHPIMKTDLTFGQRTQMEALGKNEFREEEKTVEQVGGQLLVVQNAQGRAKITKTGH